jgi:DHA1 family bicyclomycin/chloramphenicol resistance-like MFS transporter
MVVPARIESPVRLAALMALLGMFGPFTIDAFFPAFHAVQKALHASDWAMQQTISVYLLAYAVMSLFYGPLSDARGRRVVILWGVAAYTVASIGCVVATDITQLLIFRGLQGVSTGAGLIVGRALVRDVYDGADAQRVMSMISLFFGIAPALAPIIGGMVYELWNWRAVFGFLVIYGALLWWLCWRILPETHPPSARVPLALRPMLATYGRILRDGRFLLLVACSGFNFGAFFLYISSAPEFVERILALGTLGYPWFFVPCIAGMMTGAALSNRFAGRVAPRTTVRIAYAIMSCAMLLNLAYVFFVDAVAVPWAVLPLALNSVGISLSFPTLSLKMLDRYPGHRGAASSTQAFCWGLMTASIAGVLAPALSSSARTLALGAAGMIVGGLLCWVCYVRITPAATRAPPTGVVEDPV